MDCDGPLTNRKKHRTIYQQQIYFLSFKESLLAPSVGHKIPKELIWKLDTVENTELFCYFFKTLHQSRSLGSLKSPCSLFLGKISLILPSFTLLA